MAAAAEPCAAEAAAPSCDVLVVGAGPCGSAGAQMLARAGFDVVLADQHEFPRDKVCGDGLIPDAHRALARLGVLDKVSAQVDRRHILPRHCPSAIGRGPRSPPRRASRLA